MCINFSLSRFQSTPLMRGETNGPSFSIRKRLYFNPLPSCEGRQAAAARRPTRGSYFNPLPSCEGRLRQAIDQLMEMDFNPLPSCEGRPEIARAIRNRLLFQSTPLMRGETYGADGDFGYATISIHSPHARGDLRRAVCRVYATAFQSTPLMRGETA